MVAAAVVAAAVVGAAVVGAAVVAAAVVAAAVVAAAVVAAGAEVAPRSAEAKFKKALAKVLKKPPIAWYIGANPILKGLA